MYYKDVIKMFKSQEYEMSDKLYFIWALFVAHELSSAKVYESTSTECLTRLYNGKNKLK